MDELKLQRTLDRFGFTLEAYKDRFERIEAFHGNTRRRVEQLQEEYQEDREAFRTFMATAIEANRAAEKAAANVLSTKHLYIATGLLIVAIIGLVIGVRA